MPVAIALAAVVILGGIIAVAMGKGGELSRERPDLPARTDFRSWSDVADYRPPGALLGYHAGATERALALIARTIAERDAEIDWLRRRLAEVQPERMGAAPADPGAASVADPIVAATVDEPAAVPIAESAVGPAEEPVAAPAGGDPPVSELSWQHSSIAGSGVASGLSGHQPAHQPVSGRFGEDE